jgi:4-hydroxy-3-polyprenylbenzoate decarboxylase
MKTVIAVTGASGSIYAERLFEKLNLPEIRNQIEKTEVVFSDSGKKVWNFEIGNTDFSNFPFKIWDNNSFDAPFASGSSKYDVMLICPCSMGTLGRIAGGISNDLITRAADVFLKEKRKLILVSRETPLNSIHIKNMKKISEAGGIIFPASPSFYTKPTTIAELVDSVVNRILDLSGIKTEFSRWGENPV